MGSIKVKYSNESVTRLAPPRAGDVGIDLYAAQDAKIRKGERVLISTGISMEIPEGFFGWIADRSSMSKYCHVMAGIVDSSYRGEVKVALYCHTGSTGFGSTGEEFYNVTKGDKIAQILILPDLARRFSLDEVSELSATVRGDGGFGSTGK